MEIEESIDKWGEAKVCSSDIARLCVPYPVSVVLTSNISNVDQILEKSTAAALRAILLSRGVLTGVCNFFYFLTLFSLRIELLEDTTCNKIFGYPNPVSAFIHGTNQHTEYNYTTPCFVSRV
jgi:hypothetical protein